MALSAPVEALESAKEAGLRYVTDRMAGIRREKRGDGFVYLGPDGKQVRDEETLVRIKALAIPPAWTEVWISPKRNGHLQATGRDAKGRKQYKYHARWREVRDETKFHRSIDFAKALPKIRERVRQDLSLKGLPRDKVLATVVRLLETTLIRVGNEEYAKKNESFGLTTMRDKHVDVNGSKIEFHFKGKGGKKHNIDIRDKQLAKIVKKCQDVPGYELFQYEDEEGSHRTIESADVNEYIKEITGEDFTAKDFRTWAGTVLATLALREFEEFDSQTQRKRNIVKAIECVAERLGNTPSICRKCYVNPSILDAYLDGTILDALKRETERELSGSIAGLEPEEAAVLALLRQVLESKIKETPARNGHSRKAVVRRKAG